LLLPVKFGYGADRSCSGLSNSSSVFDGLDTLMIASLRSFSMDKSQVVLDCQAIFVQLLSATPRSYRLRWVKAFGIQDILSALGSTDRSTREYAAHSFGILFSEVLSNSSLTEVTSTINDLLDTAKQDNSVKSSGAILALSHALSRASSSAIPDDDDGNQLLNNLHMVLGDKLTSSKDKDLLEAVWSGIGLLSVWQVYGSRLKFPIPSVMVDDKPLDSAKVAEILGKAAKSGNERAALQLGKFSVWLDETKDADLLDTINKSLCECHEIRQTESQFAVGEAICCLAFGTDNSALETEFDTDVAPIGPERKTLSTKILEQTLKGCRESKPALRRASVIWLLSLVQFGGHHAAVQVNLSLCQRAFMSCLGDRDELVQEASARGLGLVYEKGDRKVKDDLVSDLIASFSDNKSRMGGGNVTEDTQLFEEGALRTNDGSISTYKDILNLASEIGDPSLVYRFMSLAANNAIWTSRAAFGKFGLSNVFSDSSVNGYLASNPKLFPVLYRYQFDPNPNVQRSMKSLWQSLVKDPQAVLNDNFDSIITELLKNILGREWRAREASCDAIADLIQDRKFEKYEKYMDEIWASCSKVMDDIKASVRDAAEGLSRTLTGILVRSLEAGDDPKSTSAMLSYALPFLLSPSAVDSKSQEVQDWALETLVLIIRNSRGSTLEPHIPLLLDSLIALFSSIEPHGVNYLHLNADKYKVTTAQIDQIRLRATKHSPLMEAVEKLIDSPYSNPETPDTVAAILEKAAHSAIGLPSLTATSRILVSMFLRHHARYAPHADRLLKAIRKPLVDRNDTVASSFAYTAGYIARWATDEGVESITAFAWKQWRDADADRLRIVGAEIYAAIAKHAPEVFSKHGATTLPAVFVGKHDSVDEVRESFSATWSEATSGPRAVLLHLDAIVSLASSLLGDARWRLKHAGARAIAESAEIVAGLDPMAAKVEAAKVWPALEKAAAGKSWEGKEVVLKALGTLAEKVKGFWEEDGKVATEMTKVGILPGRYL
jgi:proteasome component ECM29